MWHDLYWLGYIYIFLTITFGWASLISFLLHNWRTWGSERLGSSAWAADQSCRPGLHDSRTRDLWGVHCWHGAEVNILLIKSSRSQSSIQGMNLSNDEWPSFHWQGLWVALATPTKVILQQRHSICVTSQHSCVKFRSGERRKVERVSREMNQGRSKQTRGWAETNRQRSFGTRGGLWRHPFPSTVVTIYFVYSIVFFKTVWLWPTQLISDMLIDRDTLFEKYGYCRTRTWQWTFVRTWQPISFFFFWPWTSHFKFFKAQCNYLKSGGNIP